MVVLGLERLGVSASPVSSSLLSASSDVVIAGEDVRDEKVEVEGPALDAEEFNASSTAAIQSKSSGSAILGMVVMWAVSKWFVPGTTWEIESQELEEVRRAQR